MIHIYISLNLIEQCEIKYQQYILIKFPIPFILNILGILSTINVDDSDKIGSEYNIKKKKNA